MPFHKLATDVVIGALVWTPLLALSWLIGQIPDMPEGVKVDVGSMTATGILGWYAWHTASKTIPNLVNDFRAESKEQREMFQAELRETRAEFRAWLKEIKEDGP